MAVQQLARSATSVDKLSWDGQGFGSAVADAMWEQLPEPLREIARAELRAGNVPLQILRNEVRQIVVLAFAMPPMTAQPSAEVARIHTSHDYGNYGYDGTVCTYEEVRSGCFLAFNDPEYLDEV
jgi:hypothetical protein